MDLDLQKEFEKWIRELDERWFTLELKKTEETETILTYKFAIDRCSDEEYGIIEVDRDLLEDIREKRTQKVSEWLSSRMIDYTKAYTGSIDCTVNGCDLSLILPMRYLLAQLHEDEEFPNNLFVINPLALKQMKERNPQGYEEVMTIVNEAMHSHNN